MHIHTPGPVLFCALLISAASANAQLPAAPADQVVLERLVLAEWVTIGRNRDPKVRAEALKGWAFDPWLLNPENGRRWRRVRAVSRTNEESVSLARILGSGIVLNDGPPCPDAECRRGTHQGIVAFSPAIVSGDTAVIHLMTHHASARNTGITSGSFSRWTFVRGPTGWRMFNRELIEIS